MTTTPRLISGLSAIVLAACAVGFGGNAQAQRYIVSDLGVLPGKTESIPTAINDAAQVAGISTRSEVDESAFRYNEKENKGNLEDLGRGVTGSSTRAFGINQLGQVVGDSTFGSGSIRRAALFSKGSVADLGFLKEVGAFSRANSINSSGTIVGSASAELDGGASRAFLWTPSTGMIDIGTLGGAYAQALSINDAGYITGHSLTAKGQLGYPHAFICYAGADGTGLGKSMRDIGTLGGNSSYGMSINDNNHVAGHSSTSDGRFHAFLYDGQRMIDLGSLSKPEGADQSFALGINNADEVVGYTYEDSDQVAFIYRAGVMTNLNNLIGKAKERYLLYAATGINDKGQIIVSAFDNDANAFRGVLLTPVLASSRER